MNDIFSSFQIGFHFENEPRPWKTEAERIEKPINFKQKEKKINNGQKIYAIIQNVYALCGSIFHSFFLSLASVFFLLRITLKYKNFYT